MCSINEDDELMKPKPKIDLLGALCRKCGVAKASVVLQSKFPYCRNCFLAYFTHKFAASLGKSKLMKHGDKILLAFSGSQSSSCLADLIKSSMDESRRKKISTSTVLLYIEEAPLFEATTEERTEVLNDIHSTLLLYDFKKFYASYDSFFEEDEITLHTKYQLLLDSKDTKMSRMIADCKTETAKIELLTKARNKILIKAAKSLQCDKIFLAETSDHLASNILSNISLGRGGQLAVDVGFCDDRFDDVLIIRPLQDCSKKEVAFFNVFNELNCVTTPYFKTTDKFSSLQKLTESFVSSLQSSFPSTVSTIVSTGNKLATDSTNKESCSLCYAKIEKQSEELSAEDATLISSLVSKLGMKGFPGVASEDKNCCSKSVSEDEVSKILCYGCRLILKDFKNIEHWPSELKNKAKEYFHMKRMEGEIKEFLIE